MSTGAMGALEALPKNHFMTIPQAVAALAKMEHELDSAKSYIEIRKLERAAEALRVLFRHVAEVKNWEEPVRQHRQNCEIGSSKRPSLHSGADQLPRYGNAEVRQC
jgi:hypothetical protein